MPFDVVNIVASEVILRNAANRVDPATTARTSIAAGLIPGVMGLVVPLVVARAQKANGGGNGSAEGAAVPNVADGYTTLDQATKTLAADTFTVKTQHAFSAEVKSGVVISQSPRAGVVRPLNSAVAVVVSDGPPPSQDVLGTGGEPVTEDDLSAAKQEIEGQLTAAKQEIESQIAGLGSKIDALAKSGASSASTYSGSREKTHTS